MNWIFLENNKQNIIEKIFKNIYHQVGWISIPSNWNLSVATFDLRDSETPFMDFDCAEKLKKKSILFILGHATFEMLLLYLQSWMQGS